MRALIVFTVKDIDDIWNEFTQFNWKQGQARDERISE